MIHSKRVGSVWQEERQSKTRFDEAKKLFSLFIARVSEINDKHRLASKFCQGFQQELERLRQPSLQESSKLVSSLLDTHPTARTKKYQEAGCHHVHSDQKAILKLNECMKSLKEHIAEAQVLVHQLEELVVEVTAMADDDFSFSLDKNSSMTSICQNEKTEHQESWPEDPNVERWKTSDFAITMSAMLKMYEEDLRMQELIVSDLRLDADSECLQTYSQMWLLRPFVDDSMIHEMLKWAVQ